MPEDLIVTKYKSEVDQSFEEMYANTYAKSVIVPNLHSYLET